VDREEALSELARVAILLDATAYGFEAEDPRAAAGVAEIQRSAEALRSGIAALRDVWEISE